MGQAQRADGPIGAAGVAQRDALQRPVCLRWTRHARCFALTARALGVLLVGLITLILTPSVALASATMTITETAPASNTATVTTVGTGGTAETTTVNFTAGVYTISIDVGTITVNNTVPGVVTVAGSGTNTVTITPNSGTVSNLSFDQDNSGNAYDIQGIGHPTVIQNTSGAAGNDTINVANALTTLDDITAPLNVNYTSTTKAKLTLNDGADNATNNVVTVTATQITGIAPAPIQYTGLAAGPNSLVVIGGPGVTGNTFNVTNTPAAPAATALGTGSGSDTVNVDATSGDLTIAAASGINTVTLGSDNTVSDFVGTVTLTTGGGGTVALTVNDTGDTTKRTFTVSDMQVSLAAPSVVFFYGGGAAQLASLTVNGGPGDATGGNTFTVTNTPGASTTLNLGNNATTTDTVNVATTGGPLTINGQDGNDTVNVAATGGVLNIDGGTGTNTVTLGSDGTTTDLGGTVTVTGGGGTTLTIDNSADAVANHGATINTASLTGPLVNAVTVNYSGLTALQINGGSGGNNDFAVNGTPAAPTTTTLNLGSGADVVAVTSTGTGTASINGQNGNDTINVAATGGVLNIDGGAGANIVTLGSDNNVNDINGDVTVVATGGTTTTLTIDDSMDLMGRTFTVTGTSTTIQSPARAFNYGSAAVGSLTLLTSSANAETVNVTPSATTPITLTDAVLGGPIDIVNVNTTGLSGTNFTGTPASGSFTATGVQTVTYTNFETLQENGSSSGGTLNLSAASYTVAENAGNVTITVNRTNVSLGSVDVTVTPGNGTATATDDFDPTPRTITFANGQLTGSTMIPIVNDTLDEADETFTVTLSNPTGGATLGTQTSATVTITDDDAAPTVSVANAQAAEGNTGTTPLPFTVTLDAASGQTVSVQYATTAGTATGGAACATGVDFVTASGTLTFNPGEISKPIPVSVCGDTTNETDETFTLTLSNPTNVTLGTSTATGTIQNDDGVTGLSVANAQQPEGNTGVSPLIFTVTLGEASGQTVTVQYATGGGTATAGATCAAGVDYQTTSGTLTFNPGETSKPVPVAICGDTMDEPDETFTLTLSNPTNASITTGTATGTIQNDDGGTGLSVASVQQPEGNGVSSTMTFVVTLGAASGQTVTVQYTTTDGTATGNPSCGTSGTDYQSTSGTLTFNPGDTARTITVVICGDTTSEPDETFTLTLFNPTNATLRVDKATGTILNDDGGGGGGGTTPSVSVANAEQAEGQSGTSTLSFPVTLSAASSLPVTVQFATGGGTATAGTTCGASGVDYQSTSSSLTFNPGETSRTIPVIICGDTSDEQDETFTLTLSSPTNATLGTSTATGTIRDDDGPAQVGLGASQITRNEDGSGTVTVQIVLTDGPGVSVVGSGSGEGRANDVSAAASGFTVGVSFTTVDGTAKANVDYVPASGTVTFNPGETVKTISVTILPHGFSGNLTFQIELTNATNAVIAQGKGQITITIANLPVPPPPPDIKENKDDVDKPERLTENEDRQREHTNMLGVDDDRTEGNVVEVTCDAEPPSVTIANLDGRMVVQLLSDARQRCGDVKVGDYLEASGVKQNEQLFESDDITISHVR